MVHAQNFSEFIDEVDAYCAARGIAPSTLANRVLGGTYALTRMANKASQIDACIARLRAAMEANQIGKDKGEAEQPRPVIETPSISLDLPVPTSTNALQRSTKTGKRYNSKDYTAWRTLASNLILVERAKWAKKGLPLDQPYAAQILVSDRDKADIDNRVKALLDVLRHMSITPDDKYLNSLSVDRSALVSPSRITVTVWPVPVEVSSK